MTKIQESTQPAFPSFGQTPFICEAKKCPGSCREITKSESLCQVSVGYWGESPTHTNNSVRHCYLVLPLAGFCTPYLTPSSQ